MGDGGQTFTSNATLNLSLPASQASQYIAGVTSANLATLSNDNAIASLDLGITSVSLQRSKIGASQNRLERAQSDISSRTIALQTADSVIRDADLAQESSSLLRARILTQTGVSAFAQVNLLRQTILPLLANRSFLAS